MAELRQHVRQEWADPDGVVIVDPSAFPKKGAESCGVDRQWCGRLGNFRDCRGGNQLPSGAGGGGPAEKQRQQRTQIPCGDDNKRARIQGVKGKGAMLGGQRHMRKEQAHEA